MNELVAVLRIFHEEAWGMKQGVITEFQSRQDIACGTLLTSLPEYAGDAAFAFGMERLTKRVLDRLEAEDS